MHACLPAEVTVLVNLAPTGQQALPTYYYYSMTAFYATTVNLLLETTASLQLPNIVCFYEGSVTSMDPTTRLC
jgi:hypothetical protein